MLGFGSNFDIVITLLKRADKKYISIIKFINLDALKMICSIVMFIFSIISQ